MKSFFLLPFMCLIALSANAQNISPLYDSTLAKSLGADERGMKTYVMAILKTGPAVIEDKRVRDSLFAGHFENINRLVEQKKLIVAGPFYTNEKQYRGIFILDVTSFEEANFLLQFDPTIKEKIFDVELYQWYGSAALPVYIETHKKIEKKRPE